MRLPSLDVVLSLTAGRVDLLVKMFATPIVEVGHDVACVAPSRTDLDAGDHTAGFEPGACRIAECLEPSDLVTSVAGVTRCRRSLQSLDLLLKARITAQAKDITQAQLVTQIQNLRCAVMAIRPQQDLGLGPVLADFPDQATQMCGTLRPFRPTGRT